MSKDQQTQPPKPAQKPAPDQTFRYRDWAAI